MSGDLTPFQKALKEMEAENAFDELWNEPQKKTLKEKLEFCRAFLIANGGKEHMLTPMEEAISHNPFEVEFVETRMKLEPMTYTPDISAMSTGAKDELKFLLARKMIEYVSEHIRIDFYVDSTGNPTIARAKLGIIK